MEQEKNKLIQVGTESDTQLYLQTCKSEEETASGKRTEYLIGLTLARETGDSEDGEQITFLNASQADELIEQLSTLRDKIASANRNTKSVAQ